MPLNRKVRVFFAYTEHPDDKAVVDYFFDTLNRIPEIEVRKFRTNDFKKSDFDAITTDLAQKDFLFCVLSRHATWAFIETAIGRRKFGRDNIAIFYDKNNKHSANVDKLDARAYEFNPQKLSLATRELEGVIDYLITKAGGYIVLEAHKKTRVGDAGNGLVAYRFKILIPKHPNAGLDRIEAEFKLVGVKATLPPVKDMWKAKQSPEFGSVFTCRVIGSKEDIRCWPEEKPGFKERAKIRILHIRFNKMFAPGEVFEFGWGWTCKRMFRRRGRESSGLTARHHYSELTLQTSMEHPRGGTRKLEFSRIPHLVIPAKTGRWIHI